MAEPESITEELRTDILEGRFEPGERLVELRLTEQYNCGRFAVRSALLELSTEGLIDREANRGARVRDVSITEAIQIAQARAALETLIAGEAARNADEAQCDALISIGEEMSVAVAASDWPMYSVLNGTLHRYLREISGHDVASHLVLHLRNRGAQHRFQLASKPGRARESIKQHRAIIDAVVAGDAPAATDAMAAHLASVVEVLQNWQEPEEPSSVSGA